MGNSRRKSAEKNQWQLQLAGGRLLGPLTTKDLMERISLGTVTENDKIRKLPDGLWIEISHEPIFYDHLLDVLSQNAMLAQKSIKRVNTDNDETKIIRPKSAASAGNIDNDRTQIRALATTEQQAEQKEDLQEKQHETPSPSSNELENLNINLLKNSSPVKIELNQAKPNDNLPIVQNNHLQKSDEQKQSENSDKSSDSSSKKEKKNETEKPKKKSSPLALMLVLLSIGVFGFYIWSDPELFRIVTSYLGIKKEPITKKAEEGIKLLAPKENTKTTLSQTESQKLLKESYQELNNDTVESFLIVQDKLIKLLEGSPNDPEAKGLLCYTHLQLWPFVKQSSEDLDAAVTLKRSSSNREDLNKYHCEVSYLMITGRYSEALGVILEVGSRNDLPQSPLLSSLRAEILASRQNYKEAILWAKSAADDWKFWLRPKFQLGYYYKETAENNRAITTFNEILSKNASHKLSLIEYGVLLYNTKTDVDLAERYFVTADKNKNRVFRDQDSRLYYTLAKIYADKKMKDKALALASKAFQLNPADLKSRELVIQLGGSPTELMKGAKNYELIYLGDQFFRSGDYLAAQAEYKTAYEIDPTSALAAQKAAKSLWLLYQKQEAIKWLDLSIAADKKFGSSYFLLVDYYTQMFNFQEAADVLSKGVRNIPSNVDIQKAFGLMEYRRRNYTGAITYLEQARKKYESDIDILILLAKSYLAQGTEKDLELAKSSAVRALILDDLNVEAQVIFGKILAKGGIESAVEYFNGKIKKYSETPEFRIGLAETYKEAEKIREAQNQYESTLLLYDQNKKALMGLADCLQEQEQWLPALKKYLAAAIVDPLDPEPVFKSGIVYLEAKRYKEAKTQFQRGLELLKAYPRGYFYLGKANLALKDYTGALQAAMEERKNNPDIADSYILAGDAYLESHEYSKCANEFQTAVRLRPKGAENYVKLAQCLAWGGSLETAESMLNIATAQESGYAEIYKVQGYIFEKQGQISEAVQAYEKYITLAPYAPDKKSVEDKIQSLGGGN